MHSPKAVLSSWRKWGHKILVLVSWSFLIALKESRIAPFLFLPLVYLFAWHPGHSPPPVHPHKFLPTSCSLLFSEKGNIRSRLNSLSQWSPTRPSVLLGEGDSSGRQESETAFTPIVRGLTWRPSCTYYKCVGSLGPVHSHSLVGGSVSEPLPMGPG